MKRDDIKCKKRNRNNTLCVVLLVGGTTIDIIDITVHIEIIDRESHNKYLKRNRDAIAVQFRIVDASLLDIHDGYRFCSSLPSLESVIGRAFHVMS